MGGLRRPGRRKPRGVLAGGCKSAAGVKGGEGNDTGSQRWGNVRGQEQPGEDNALLLMVHSALARKFLTGTRRNTAWDKSWSLGTRVLKELENEGEDVREVR